MAVEPQLPTRKFRATRMGKSKATYTIAIMLPMAYFTWPEVTLYDAAIPVSPLKCASAPDRLDSYRYNFFLTESAESAVAVIF